MSAYHIKNVFHKEKKQNKNNDFSRKSETEGVKGIR